MSVVKQQANLKRWKRSVSDGHRWMAETAFSSIKRMFGEHVNILENFLYGKGNLPKGNSV